MPTFEKDFIPMGGPIYKIPRDSNLRWMMMFYALPREFVEKQPMFLDMPRRIREIIGSEEWMARVNSDTFLELIWDSYAWIGWQFFQVPAPHGGLMPVPGTVNHYSGDFPLWRYSYMLPSLILQRFETMQAFTLQTLFLMGKDYEAPWSVYETFYGFVGQLTLGIIAEQHWQEAFDVVWQNRAHEDYNGCSVKQQDFERSWTHSRKPKANESVEQTQEQPGTDPKVMQYAACQQQSFEDSLADADLFERFTLTLPEVDQRIIQLRQENLTLAEIAKKVGFAGAGTVSKHLCEIKTKYDAYKAQT